MSGHDGQLVCCGAKRLGSSRPSEDMHIDLFGCFSARTTKRSSRACRHSRLVLSRPKENQIKVNKLLFVLRIHSHFAHTFEVHMNILNFKKFQDECISGPE